MIPAGPSGARRPLPTSPLSGGRSVIRGSAHFAHPPAPLFSLSLAGGGSGWGSRQGEEARKAIRTLRTPSEHDPRRAIGRASPPPDLPPCPLFSLPLAGGGSGWGSRQGEEARKAIRTLRTPSEHDPRRAIGRASPPPDLPPCPLFSLPLPGGGSGWESRQGEERERRSAHFAHRQGMIPRRAVGRPDPPPDLPPVRGEECEWSGEMERQRPPSVPRVLPLPCRGRAGVGVAPGGEARRAIRTIRTPSGHDPSPGRQASGPPSRPPPCQGGGV